MHRVVLREHLGTERVPTDAQREHCESAQNGVALRELPPTYGDTEKVSLLWGSAAGHLQFMHVCMYMLYSIRALKLRTLSQCLTLRLSPSPGVPKSFSAGADGHLP